MLEIRFWLLCRLSALGLRSGGMTARTAMVGWK